jgi:hypothetical protein
VKVGVATTPGSVGSSSQPNIRAIVNRTVASS